MVHNRTDDCCTERLRDYTVILLDTNRNIVFTRSVNNAPAPSRLFNSDGIEGRTVRIQLNGQGTLSLAEVEVLGGAR